MQKPWLDDSLAANGRPVKENFSDWFGQSQVVDEKGDPMVVFHGTPNHGFDSFDHLRIGNRDRGDFGRGFYFSPSKRYASTYEHEGAGINQVGEGSKTYAVHLSLKNPLKVSARQGVPLFIDEQYDGVMVYCDKFYELPFWHIKNLTEIVVFNAGQIKSAVDNSGLYLKNSTSLTDLAEALALRNDVAMMAKAKKARAIVKKANKGVVHAKTLA